MNNNEAEPSKQSSQSNHGALPKFEVNVIDPAKVNAPELSAMIASFEAGSDEPLVLGAGNTPQAALIPFRDFVRLLRHDHRARVLAHDYDEQSFVAEIAARVRASEHGQHEEIDLQQLGDQLGEPAASMIEQALRNE